MGASATLTRTSFGTLFRLGRVSNLPTVWTNVVAATVLAGADPVSASALLAMVAMTLFYVGGMYLNDAFDREIDRRERAGRPIPSGVISVQAVFIAGFGMLGTGFVLMAIQGWEPALAGAMLACCVVA